MTSVPLVHCKAVASAQSSATGGGGTGAGLASHQEWWCSLLMESFVERRRQCSGVYNWVAGSSHPPLRSKPAWPSSRLWFFVVSNELNKLPLLQLSGNIFLCLCAFDFSSKFIWLIWSYVYLLYNINEDTVIAPAGSDYLLKLKICMLFLNEIKMLNNLRALGRILSSCFEIDLITQNDISLVLQ